MDPLSFTTIILVVFAIIIYFTPKKGPFGIDCNAHFYLYIFSLISTEFLIYHSAYLGGSWDHYAYITAYEAWPIQNVLGFSLIIFLGFEFLVQLILRFLKGMKE